MLSDEASYICAYEEGEKENGRASAGAGRMRGGQLYCWRRRQMQELRNPSNDIGMGFSCVLMFFIAVVVGQFTARPREDGAIWGRRGQV